MRADNSAFLLRAAARRHQDSLQRARDALLRLDRAAEPITFQAVSNAAHVSRSWLYREPAIRAEIERLRTTRPTPGGGRLPAAEQASTESPHRRLELTTDKNRRLEHDNRQLRDQLARLLGERRSTGH